MLDRKQVYGYNAKLLGKLSQSDSYARVVIFYLIDFQNKFICPNSKTSEISLYSGLKCSTITHSHAKTFMWHKCQRVFSSICTSARPAGRFDCLMTSLILITMHNGSPVKFLTNPQKNEKGKCVLLGLRSVLQGFLVTMHEGMCETGNQIPSPIGRGIWRTVHTSLSALWQQTPADRT